MTTADIQKHRDIFVRQLQKGRGNADSGYSLAVSTVSFLRRLIAQAKYTNINDLLQLIKIEGGALTAAAGTELVVSNMVLRVLKLVRDEHLRMEQGLEEILLGSDLPFTKLWEHTYTPTVSATASSEQPATNQQSANAIAVDITQLRASLVTTLGEFLQELECASDNISELAAQHVHPRDTVLTYGYSSTVARFLRAAAELTRFRVLVALNCPSNNGERMCTALTAPIDGGKVAPRFDGVTVVADASMYTCMARVQRVVIGAQAVLADGGFIGVAGTYSLCLAAHKFAVPVTCVSWHCVPIIDSAQFNRMRSPLDIVDVCDGGFIDKVDVFQSTFDYVPPELVSLYLTQTPGNAPSYVYRLLGEYYHADDVKGAA